MRKSFQIPKPQVTHSVSTLKSLLLSTIIMVVLSLLFNNNIFAQTINPPVQPTPSGTDEPFLEDDPSEPPVDSSQTGRASIVKVIPVGTSPNAIVLNPVTRKAYLINTASSNVSILDISSDTLIRNIRAGQRLYWGLALKPESEHLYVSDNAGGTVLEIQEASSSVVNTIFLGPVLPEGIAISRQLNKAYVAHSGNLLSVINLDTNQILKQIDTGYWNHLIATNESTNRVYITKSGSNQVAVFDGVDDSLVQHITVGRSPWGVAVNSNTNRIYVTNSSGNSISVIDGNNNTVMATISVQRRPWGIAVNETANRIYVANSWSNSVSIIDGSTNQVVETVHNVGRQPSGIATNPRSGKVYVTNELGNNVTVILDEAAIPESSALIPVILVPGYYASFNAHRMYPSPNNFRDEWEWWPGIFGLSAGDVYQPLINALERAGYDSDPNSPRQNLFIAHYNWLRPNSDSAANDLTAVISQALSKTSATKIHIITHSNGGLVTRNWIQSQPTNTVVDQLIMLAPPNGGVARVYPAWAGGDISREALKVKLFVFGRLLYAYEAGLNCSQPGVCLVRPETYHNFIHAHIPSARDLIPVYDFLVDSDGQFKRYQDVVEKNRNLNLEKLNANVQGELLSKVNHLTIIGGLTSQERTFDAYQYETCSDCSPLWLDGKITTNLYFDGDGTVGRHHVKLPGIDPIVVDANHTDIVRIAIPNIFDILQLSIPAPPVIPVPVPTPQPLDALVYTVVRNIYTDEGNVLSSQIPGEEGYSVPVHLLVIDPLERQLGYQPDGTFINQIPHAFYHGDRNEPKLIYIPDPLEGVYHSIVTGNDAGTYGIIVTTQRTDESSVIITGTTSSGLETLHSIIYTASLSSYLPFVFRQNSCLDDQYTPIDVMLVLDRSSSMGQDGKLEAAINATRTFLDFMDFNQEQAGIVSFDRDASLVQELTQDRAALDSALNTIRLGQGTAIGDGIAKAHTELQSDRHVEGHTPIIILLTDGEHTAGRDPLAAADAAKAAGIRIFAIGLGAAVHEDVLRQIASDPNDYYFSPGPNELNAIYETIAGVIHCP